MIDEFQNMTEFAQDFFTTKKNWKNIVLMSATPDVPLVAAAAEAGIKFLRLKSNNLRRAKRFLLWGKPNLKFQRLATRECVFTTKSPEEPIEKLGI